MRLFGGLLCGGNRGGGRQGGAQGGVCLFQFGDLLRGGLAVQRGALFGLFGAGVGVVEFGAQRGVAGSLRRVVVAVGIGGADGCGVGVGVDGQHQTDNARLVDAGAVVQVQDDGRGKRLGALK